MENNEKMAQNINNLETGVIKNTGSYIVRIPIVATRKLELNDSSRLKMKVVGKNKLILKVAEPTSEVD